MESGEMPEIYYTHEGRVASFQPTQQPARRGSTAKGKASKIPSWPHKQLDPDTFARAGLYFAPTPDFPDNTVCFLCHKNMGGWEEDDSPFVEHLRLSPHCGWAIVAGIETGLGDYALDDPTGTAMTNARKATFGDRWPHDGKRGWKCKTKQLADAGWKYTPTTESDDMATCTYCQLALDGWEPKDNPMDEHHRRSPECPFFVLMNQYKAAAAAKKKGRGKTARSSKASRASTQSVATVASDVTSLLEHSVDPDDSVLTTTSVMTQGGTKRPRAKKATTSKGKKSRAKKEEIVEVLEDPPEDAQPENHEEPLPVETEVVDTKPARGQKRKSATIEDSVLSSVEAPAPKKRAGRGNRISTKSDHAMFDPQPPEIENAVIEAEFKALQAEMEAEPEQTLHVPKKGRQAGTRKASKQTTKKTKTKAPAESEAVVVPNVDELADGEDGSILSSSGTVGRGSFSTTSAPAPKKRGRPSKQSLTRQAASQPEPAIQAEPIAQPIPALDTGVKRVERVELEPALPITQTVAAVSKVTKTTFLSRDKSLPPPPPESPDTQPPSTPKAMNPSAPAARQQAAPSPSQSPQSSDAENQPPSSKPSNTSRSARPVLAAPVPATPVRSSPSRGGDRNVIGGLESTSAWTAVDIENVFNEVLQHNNNTRSSTRLARAGTDLTSPERRMTVEEWIRHNAAQAEAQLRRECEAFVTKFEQQGIRAIEALEGIIAE
ncbi:hypothetical protein F5Y14DRAFT_23559 [Nemania sp. NC0429]|nr:hypothetical protein F5Y14DRAFT_23559 [Nemania sp. NC0429]